MGFETPTSEHLLSRRSDKESPPINERTIANVIENSQMYKLPNKPEMTEERLRITANALAKQYAIALRQEETRTKTLSRIKDLLQIDKKDDEWIKNIKDIFETAPQEAAPALMLNLRYLPEGIREDVARLALEKAPQEVAPALMLNLRYLPEGIREEIVRLALEKAPQEAAPALMLSLRYLPEGIREEIVRLGLEKAPQEAAPALMLSLRCLPEGIREEIVRLGLEKAPQEAAPALMLRLEYLPEGIREEIVRLALEKAPQEAAPELMLNLRYLPEGIREEIQSQLIEVLCTTERNTLAESEVINPILYKKIEGLENKFSRKEFPKTGTRTMLLGGSLKNQAILRIIPNHAFISWVKAYSAVEKWKEAGFEYVPIEPILKASLCKDGKNARIYAGVLGVSVAKYLKMYSNREHHQNVERQVEAIITALDDMGVTHGHEHYDNFCVLHNRKPNGDIDWSIPPRVYCIDFDQSISN